MSPAAATFPYTDNIHANFQASGTVILGGDCDDFVHVSGALTAACGIKASGLSAGSVADGNSYLGLDTNNQVVLVGGSTPSLAGDLIAGTDCTNYFHFSSSWTASCDSLILDDKKLYFGSHKRCSYRV